MLTLVTLIKIGYYWRGFPINFAEYFRTAILQNICERMLLILSWSFYRSNHQRCSMRKGVLRNFAKLTGKHLCQNLFFNKVAGLRPDFIKKETLAQVFSCNFVGISRNTFFTEHHRMAASGSNVFTSSMFMQLPAGFVCFFSYDNVICEAAIKR